MISQEEKERRISRVLTIDEIINPGYRNSPSRPPPPTQSHDVTHVALRINQSQVVYQSHQRQLSGIVVTSTSSEAAVQDQGNSSSSVGGKKSVSFATNRSSTGTLPSISPSSVYREQYWSWSCSCKTWSKRERNLLLGLGILAGVILGLVAFISVAVRASSSPPPTLNDSWLPWTL